MEWISVGLFILVVAPFVWLYTHEKRTLWLGFWFMVSGTLGYTILFVVSFSKEAALPALILTVLGAITIIGLLLSPLIVLIGLFYSGVMVIRREGFNLVNCLALGLGVGGLAYLFIWPLFHSLAENTIFTRLYAMIGLIITYLVVLIASYTMTNFLNFIHLWQPKMRYVVVLGAGLNGTEVTPLLASRINKGIKLYRRHPEQIQLIMSGGQGGDEVIAEGEAMRLYARKQGVPDQAIIVESASRNTQENIRFSRQLMTENAPFVIVTNYYHLLRALLIAKQEGVQCEGYGAKTKLYFSINAFIREFIGYLVMSQQIHLKVLKIVGMLYVLLEIIYLISQLPF